MSQLEQMSGAEVELTFEVRAKGPTHRAFPGGGRSLPPRLFAFTTGAEPSVPLRGAVGPGLCHYSRGLGGGRALSSPVTRPSLRNA